MRVLVVDDSATMRMIMRQHLRRSRIDDGDVREVDDGAAALAEIDAWRPDVVLSDWHMPTMTGIDLLRAVRAAGNLVPFGFVTGTRDDAVDREAAAAGAAFVIAKPFSADELRARLATVERPSEVA